MNFNKIIKNVSGGMVVTGSILTISALTIITILKSISGQDLSYFTVVGITVGILSLGDLGLGPTLIREIIKKTEYDDSLNYIIKQIRNIYKKIIVIVIFLILLIIPGLSIIYEWHSTLIITAIFWFLTVPLTMYISWQDIFLCAKNRVLSAQKAVLLQKTLIFIILTTNEYLVNSDINIILIYVVSLYFGIYGKYQYNRFFNFKKNKSINSTSFIDEGAVIKKCIPFGCYYLVSMMMTKIVFYYLNYSDYIKIDNVNVLEKILTYISLIGNIPTTYLMPKHIQVSKKQNTSLYKNISYLLLIILIILLIIFSYLIYPDYLKNIDEVVFLLIFYFITDEIIKIKNSYDYGSSNEKFIKIHFYVFTSQIIFIFNMYFFKLIMDETITICGLLIIYQVVYCAFKIIKKI